jgi:uncharacterized protein YqjF (DUF2071 family)
MAQKSKFLTAFWKNLIMANYEVNPDILTKFVPQKTELDFFNSKCLVSLVGFMFLDTKVLGIPIPFHRNFEEVNLRFYVKHKSENDGNEIKRGVTFIKEIVPKSLIKHVANNIYAEKYESMPMRNELNISHLAINTGYFWKYQAEEYYIKTSADKNSFMAAPGSEEEFITEHYWGYTKVNESETSEYQVEHPKWKLHEVKTHEINCDFGKLYGEQFSFLNKTIPSSVFLAEGSEIIVRKGSNL